MINQIAQFDSKSSNIFESSSAILEGQRQYIVLRIAIQYEKLALEMNSSLLLYLTKIATFNSKNYHIKRSNVAVYIGTDEYL